MAIRLNPLIVIVGPTGSGKTDLALKIAKKFDGEIICADSWTVRREVNIGTAKPSLKDQKIIKHHLIDIIDPDEMFSAAQFKRLANKSIKDILSRNKIPIMIGGSGLYIDGVIYNFSFLPPTKSRIQLNKLNLEELVKKADKLKLLSSKIDRHNKRHLIRLIESKGLRPSKNNLRKNTVVIGLKIDRTELKQRLELRSRLMIDEGLKDEVLAIIDKYGWDCEALKGVNYSQWKDYLKGKIDYEELKVSLVKANYDLAKKQMTWFKRNKSIHWIDTPVNLTKVVDLITTFLNN